MQPTSTLTQAVLLSPRKPGGQEQSTSWFLTLHSAELSQGLAMAHGSTQWSLMQAYLIESDQVRSKLQMSQKYDLFCY